MFSRRPVKKLSTQITSWPLLRSLSQRCEPIKPAPPVTSILISIVFEFRVSGFEFERAGAGPLPNCKCIALRQISPVEYRNSTNHSRSLEGACPRCPAGKPQISQSGSLVKMVQNMKCDFLQTQLQARCKVAVT